MAGAYVWADDSRPDMSMAEMRQRLVELREQLANGASGPGAGARERSGGDPQGHAETADGLIRVEAAGGRLGAIRLDSRVMRMPSDQLGGLLTETCNAALERAAASAVTADGETAVDFDALARQFQQVHNEGLRQMERMTQGLHDAIQVIRQRAIVRGEVEGGGLERLLEDTARSVEAMRRPAPEPEAEARGPAETERLTAYGLNDLIRVRAESSGTRLGEIGVDERAMRHPSRDIADETVRAANQALRLAREAAMAPMRQAGQDLAATVARLQDASIEQLGTLTESLGRLMGGIDRPSR